MRLKAKSLAAIAVSLFVGSLYSAGSAVAENTFAAAKDLGRAAADNPQPISIILKLHNVDKLADRIAQSVNPDSPLYLQFLSVEDFTAQFAPSDFEIETVKVALKQVGFDVTEVYKNHMVIRAVGTTAQVNKLLNTEIHTYKKNNISYTKPSRDITIPAKLRDIVLTVTGLDTEPKIRPLSRNVSKMVNANLNSESTSVKLQNPNSTINSPGSLTVADVAKLYNITPLYNQQILGQGRTVGIATLATFKPSDAYTYWKSVGLNVAQDRITQVKVDGGAGTNGSDETTLDVQQAGGLAPAAKVIVYEAPNSDSGFIDVFLKAAEENKVDSISVSWGLSEIAQGEAFLASQHQAFMALAAQGITVFAASGDQGAYDINGNQGPYSYPTCSQLLSVDSPSSDPYVVAAGGLTLAGVQTFKSGSITIPADRPWAWDYLQNYYTAHVDSAYYFANLFPVGGGGGVSVYFPVPDYQKNVPGVEVSAPNQSLICQRATGPETLQDMPEGYAGRNTPDVSLNADPSTGYSIFVNGAWHTGWGGTSFVSPQLNGIAALMSQVRGTRLGHINPQLYYRMSIYGYSSYSPFRAITSGDNEYWQATASYNPASGLGALDVANLAASYGWNYQP